jgi:glyoxylase-like metal-dependent hydrolase (beta-lactamase superfamily II)
MLHNQIQIKAFFDEFTSTVTYVVYDPNSLDAVVIDSVLDYEPNGSKISTKNIDILVSFLKEQKLNLHFTLETHAHADHLTGAQELKKHFPKVQIGITERIQSVQEVFKKIYNLPENFIPNGKQFDRLLKDDEILKAGSLEIKVIPTPGHTPACTSFLVGDAVFVGDLIFMPDTGTGRCDFPKGSSQHLWESVTQKIFTLPDSTRVFVGHDYKGGGTREASWETTVGEEKKLNIQLKGSTTLEEYKKMRDGRDKNLAVPRLLLPSLQVNIDAGRLPKPESNGTRYLKMPLTI